MVYFNLPLHHKVQKFSSGTGSPGWSRKKGRKTVVVWCGKQWFEMFAPECGNDMLNVISNKAVREKTTSSKVQNGRRTAAILN